MREKVRKSPGTSDPAKRKIQNKGKQIETKSKMHLLKKDYIPSASPSKKVCYKTP